tara:strand:- start:254 stop:481 length:228 start_codon:yes stop_codon:yes gene_type:complete
MKKAKKAVKKKEVKIKTADKKPLYKKKELTTMEKQTLKSHSKHHTKEHIDEMKKDMKKGFCFQQAHNRAIKKVGK